MKKIAKILAILVSMTLVCNLQAFSVSGEEILPDPVIETEAESESVIAEDTEEEAVTETDAAEAFETTEVEGPAVEDSETVSTEEPVVEDSEPEEKLGDIEYKYCKPYEEAAYKLKYHVQEDQTISIDGYTREASGELIIPSEIEEKAVTVIGEEAFADCDGFTGSLTIPDSVTTIEACAFYNCSGLTGNLTIPDSVTTIGTSAFADCSGFTGSLTIPDSVTTIGNGAFYGCGGFTGSLTIPDSVTTIGRDAFGCCSGFTGSLKIPDSVTTIGDYAFGDCVGFTGDLTIGDSVTEIGSRAFLYCVGFTGSLTIGDSVMTIGEKAFRSCDGFRKVVNRSSLDYALSSPAGQTWINAKTGEQITGSPATITNGTAIRSDYYAPVNAPYFTHDAVEAQTYTGKAIKPAVKVYFGMEALEEKTDYTIKFANNTNAGMASFTVTGKGNYAGNDSDSFEILKKNLIDDDITFTEPAAAKYTKKEQTPVPKLTYNGITLKKDKDFTVAYYSDRYCSEWCIPKEPGEYCIKITGTGNYEGELKTPFVIVNPKKKLVSTLKADKIKDREYTGNPIELDETELVIRDGKTPLTKGTEYEVTGYSDNTLPGTAKVTIRGKEENGYAGTLTLTFKIKGTPISRATITAPADVLYDGTEKKPAPEVKLNGGNLEIHKDYELVYEKNINAGKAKVTIKGKGGYTGSVSKTFTIRPAEIEEGMITLGASYPYTASGAKPPVTVTFERYELATGPGIGLNIVRIELKEGKDYTVKYTNNTAVNAGTGTKKPTVTVTGKGNFTGKAEKTFAITEVDLETCRAVADDVVYSNKKGNWKTKKVTILGPDGKALKAGTDYDKSIHYTSDSEGETEIDPTAKLDAGTTVYVWADAKGTNYSGTAMGSYRIVARDIGKLTATPDLKLYTGKAVKLSRGDIRWKSGTKAVNDVTFDFDESSYKNNVNKGKATVIVKGKGNYGGSKTITFTIGTKGILWWWRNLFN